MNQKSFEDDKKNKFNKMQEESLRNLSGDVAKFIVGAKTIGHMVRKLPKAISERNEVKKKGENPEGIFDYIEEPEFEWQEEEGRVSESVYQKIQKLTTKLGNFIKHANPLYGIKKLYEVIRNGIEKRKIEKLPEGRGEKVETDKHEGKKEFVKGLSENVPTLEEQNWKSKQMIGNLKNTKTLKADKLKEL